jgi:hypothetical protein
MKNKSDLAVCISSLFSILSLIYISEIPLLMSIPLIVIGFLFSGRIFQIILPRVCN